jgi:hypothetical protein
MTPTDLLIPIIALILGIVSEYLFFRQQISAIEGRVSWWTIFLKDEDIGDYEGIQ